MGFVQTQKLLKLWQRDPVCWANDTLPEPPREWQEEALSAYATHDWTSIAGCRKAGKSRFLGMVGLHWLTTRFESMTFTTAPTWAQVHDAVWTEIGHLWSTSQLPSRFPDWEILSARIKTPYPRWRGIGVSSQDVQNIEGRHAGSGGALIIIDEAKAVPDPFFDSVLNMIGEKGQAGKIVVAGTPGIPRGFFYRSHATERYLWGYQLRVNAHLIPRLADRAERARLRLGADNPFYRQQQLAEFAMAEGNVCIPLNLVEAAVERDIEEKTTWKRYVSLDPSGMGEDESVLGFRHGPILEKIIPWQAWDETRSATFTVEQAINYGADAIIVDEPGIGLAICYVVDTLLKAYARRPDGRRIPLIRYKPGSPPRDRERFANRKAEDIFDLADMFREGNISIPDHPALIGQLVSWTWTDARRSKTEVIDPPDSPDYADMCNMAYAIESSRTHIKSFSPRGIH